MPKLVPAVLAAFLWLLPFSGPTFAQVAQAAHAGHTCLSATEFPPDAKFRRIGADTEGDPWVVARVPGTTKGAIGFISMDSGKFCGMIEITMDPET